MLSITTTALYNQEMPSYNNSHAGTDLIFLLTSKVESHYEIPQQYQDVIKPLNTPPNFCGLRVFLRMLEVFLHNQIHGRSLRINRNFKVLSLVGDRFLGISIGSNLLSSSLDCRYFLGCWRDFSIDESMNGP